MSIEHNAGEIAAALRAATATIGPRAHAVTATYAVLLRTRIMARASGRPGPRAITGDYRRSFTVDLGVMDGGMTSSAIVGTNKPQGKRLEYGFVGEDALGRHYDQPPFPHAGPAFDQTEPEYLAAIAAIPGWVS